MATLSTSGVRRLGAGGSLAAFAMAYLASGETNLELTSPLVWLMIAIAVGGTLVTFSFLVYAVWKFRDPNTKHRRYG